ncbi:MAG: hypothetical protein ACI9VS_000525 [Candidatus Binatia bacterium]|jgi:hypothetical protein
MMKTPDNPDEELQELKHEPWPGYSEKFFWVFAVTGVWLALLVIWGMKLGIYIGH